MKRYIYIMFACVCAMLFVSTAAQAQVTGDIVTISNGNNYLGVNENGTAIATVAYNNVDEHCYWRVTVSGDTYTFQSVIGNQRYLNIPNTNNNNLTLGNSQDITKNGNYFYRHSGNRSYYIYFDGANWIARNNTNYRTELDLNIIPKHSFVSVDPADGDELSELSTITIKAEDNVTINAVNEDAISISGGATISDITYSGNTLTVSVTNGETEGDYTLTIPANAVTAQYGIGFEAATYSWTVVAKGHKYVTVTPETGVTSAFTEITITTDVDMESELRFGPYAGSNNSNISFTHTNGTTVKTSIVGEGLGIKKIDSRTFKITLPNDLGEGTYKLTINEGAINGADGEAFQKKTYTWTVNAHTFASITPESVPAGQQLETITLTATDNVKMTIADASKIVLKNAGNAVIPVTATIDANNQLVITPAAALGNGTYTLTIDKGAVQGPQHVNFEAYTKTWSVIVTVAITHVNGFYPNLGAGGYQQVHTVERTIYYTGEETSLPLELAETAFYGYMRWYDYDHDNGNDITWATAPRAGNNNFVELQGSTTHLGWFGWNNGTTGGVMSEGTTNQTPYINVSGWTGNHTIACDASHYLDFVITRVDNQVVGITEPRLSYRQLFHFKPASEMADKFAALGEDEFLEEYTYTAPTGTDVYLSTDFRYNGTTAENCYFYYDGASIERVTSATWSAGTTSGAFRVVSSDTEGTQTYTLTANNGELRIAKFTVTYVDKAEYGPVVEEGTNGSAKALMSYAEMNANYEVLEYNNFSFGQTPTSSAQQYLTTPLPWDQSTYGFSHMASDAIKPNNQYGVPYYGEYAIVNRIGSTYWEESANHVDGGATVADAASQGFGIYVDGTEKPGVVASISTKVTICAERRMYCSVWLRNPRPSGQCGNGVYKPIFRCNVQGRNKLSDGTYTAWENVGVYFVGELDCASGWNQVLFPIESEETYSECRVQIYNFGTGGNGNDFWLDDLCIFADKLPMASYQLQTDLCCSPNHDGTTFTAVVLRVDYSANSLDDNTYQYYQIYNKTAKQPLVLTDEALSPYYHENTTEAAPEGLTKQQYGSILVRPHTFNPTEAGETICEPSVLVGDLLAAYNENPTEPLWGKCFTEKKAEEITEESPGQHYMYVVHIIPNIKSNRIKENYLHEHCEYTLRMTNSADGLIGETLSCAVEIALPATQESLFRLISDQIETTEFLTQSLNNCANDLYTVEAFIRKDSDPYSDAGKAEGTYLADWMYGHAFDDVYRMDYPHASDQAEDAAKDAADLEFEKVYHCTRAQVTDAFLDLRRPDDNGNYGAKTFADISPEYFTDYNTPENQEYASKSKYYETLKYLHEQGWLQLATSSVSFYLGSESVARYWVFPIEYSAVATNGEPLHDCPEPRWVEIHSVRSNYAINVAPGFELDNAALRTTVDPRQGNSIPNVRVLARMVNNTIQIPINQVSTEDYEITFTGDDGYIYLTNDANITTPQNQKYSCSRSGDVITLIPAAGNTAKLEIGKEYTMCVRMRDKNGAYKASGDMCNVGKVFVNLVILPDVVTWTPTAENTSWHNDACWTGYGTGMGNYHYAPIAGSGVIIPANNGNNPDLNVIGEDEPHPYPLDANFALTPTCGQIYFEPGAMMLNQDLLIHDKAFVDLVVPNQTWNTVAVPISGVVSGDMFIPHEGDENNGTVIAEPNPFEVSEFQGSRHHTSAFPFWMSVYNKTVEVMNDNPSLNGTKISTNTKAFASTNSLTHDMEVGSGYQLLGWGPANLDADAKLTIRLPKPDAVYSYYYSSGNIGYNAIPERGDNPSKLVYSSSEPVVLKNEQPSQSYMFGNPTMAMIDLATFLPEDATVYKMEQDGWVAETDVTLEKSEDYRYLAPMQSVLIEIPVSTASAGGSEYTLPMLTAEHLTTPERIEQGASNIAGRTMSARANKLQLMTIYADLYGTKSRCLVGSLDTAEDIYAVGEDALFISSGVEAAVNSATATSPVNMYTLSDNVPMMVDVRDGIDTVPLAMVVQDIYQTEKVTFTFELCEDWDKDVYFCDSKTGAKTLIFDGMEIELELPANHETRYFLEGPDKFEPGNDIWSSTENVKGEINVWAYSPDNGQLVVTSNDILKSVEVYDLSGRLVADKELELQYNSTSLSIPTGAYIIKAALRDNSVHTLSSLVK